MTDALETRARQLILCVWVWVRVCVFILQKLQCVFVEDSEKSPSGVVRPIHYVLEQQRKINVNMVSWKWILSLQV